MEPDFLLHTTAQLLRTNAATAASQSQSQSQQQFSLQQPALQQPLQQQSPQQQLSLQQWQMLKPYLHWHRVGLRLATRLQPLLPSVARIELLHSSHAQLQHINANINTLCRIAECLTAHHLRYLSIKGPALSQQLYGSARIKQSADIDILVSADDVQATIAALKTLSIEPERVFPQTNSTWKTVKLLCKDWNLNDAHNNVHVELHWRVENNPYLLPTCFNEWFSRKQSVSINDHEINVMSMQDIFLHILVHGARSLWTRLHWLADFDALLRRDDIDWPQAAAQIKKLQLTQLLAYSMSLSQQLLESPQPEPLRTLTETLSPAQHKRCEKLHQYTIDAMNTRKHHTHLAFRHGQLLLTPRPAFWLYEFATFVGPHHPDVERMQLPIYLLPLYILLRPWFVIERWIGIQRQIGTQH